MSAWDVEYLNEEVQAFIEFDGKDGGSFQFACVQGQMHYRTKTRNGIRAVQFSWEGGDGADGTPLEGIGWATLDGDELKGTIGIHMGEDSEFVAKSVARHAPKRKPAKHAASKKTARSTPKFKPTAEQMQVEKFFPAIAEWVEGYGHIEIGNDEGLGFVVRALDFDDLVFEDDRANTLAEAMATLEESLAKWIKEDGSRPQST